MWVFMNKLKAGAILCVLFSGFAVPAQAQFVKGPAASQTDFNTKGASRETALKLKFDGIDLASFERASHQAVQRDVYSRVRTEVNRAGIKATPAEMDMATKRIIRLLKSEHVRAELSKNSSARVTINVDLTFQPLSTEATFKF